MQQQQLLHFLNFFQISTSFYVRIERRFQKLIPETFVKLKNDQNPYKERRVSLSIEGDRTGSKTGSHDPFLHKTGGRDDEQCASPTPTLTGGAWGRVRPQGGSMFFLFFHNKIVDNILEILVYCMKFLETRNYF